MAKVGNFYLLRDALEDVKGRYGQILIDCPPSLGLLTINALSAADVVLIPVQCQFSDSLSISPNIAINAEITLLYWQVGNRIHTEILQGQRAEYGNFSLSKRLTQAYGRGWSERQLNYCVLIAEVFPEREILHTLSAELSWSHLKLIIGIEDPLKRDFYIEIAKLERWSVRQLQERINSMLFERTATKRPRYPRLSRFKRSLPRKRPRRCDPSRHREIHARTRCGFHLHRPSKTHPNRR